MFRLLLILLPLLLASHEALAHDKEVEGEEVGGAEAQPEALCDAGAAQLYPCSNTDLLAWLPTGVFGAGRANDIWGWTDRRSGREYALIGLAGGTAFVDLSDPAQPIYLGLLPTQTRNSIWRDIKTYRDHAFVVSEAFNHGLQIFDRGRCDSGEPSFLRQSLSARHALRAQVRVLCILLARGPRRVAEGRDEGGRCRRV